MVKPRLDELAEFYANPLDHRMLRVDGVAIACGIVVEDAERRSWGFLDIRADRVGNHGPKVVRAVRRYLDALGKPVLVLCHAEQFPTAPKLLTVLGFKPTDTYADGKRVWLWQS